MTINIQKLENCCLSEYDAIEMIVPVKSVLMPEESNEGEWGIFFREVPVNPWEKDLGAISLLTRTAERFDISDWAIFGAFDDDKMIGGAVIAGRIAHLCILSGREDLALLWDIRVDRKYQQQGVGSRLFKIAANWAGANGYRQLKIESQNNNVGAFHFYRKLGATIGGIDRYAYRADLDPEQAKEIAFYWYIDL